MVVNNNVSENNIKLNINFNRDIAKSTQVKIFSEIFDNIMSYGQAEKLTGNSKGNIQRAAKGKTLLNAKNSALIIKTAYNLKSYYEIKNHIFGCSHLNKYFMEELGQMYEDSSFEDESIATNVLCSIDDSVSRAIYGLLYALKRIKYQTLINLFGEADFNSTISKLALHNIIIDHKKLAIVEFNEKMVTSNFSHNKKQLEIVASSVTEKSIKDGNGVYGQDIALLTPKQKKFFINKLRQDNQKNLELLKSFEKEATLEERTEVVDYSLISFLKFNISKSLLEKEIQQ